MPERNRLETLEQQVPAIVGTSPETVGQVLPEAAARATSERGQELAIALEPAVTTAVESMARRRPEVIGAILAPTIATAVRKAVTEALAAMLERIDEVLQRSMSLQGLKWRIEAARTRRPLAEIVLLRTLRYRVEQVLLIHNTTSLVLQHVVAPTLHAQSPDQVAAMLSAIDSFGREALGSSDEAHLEKFQLGDLVVWVDRGPSITLTAIIRGSATADLGRQLRQVRERIFFAVQKDLDAFRNDATPFLAVRGEMESLLLTERKKAPSRAPLGLALAGTVLVAAAGTLSWRAHAHTVAVARARAEMVAALASEPGIVVTSAAWSGGRGRVSGLRDPLAPAPEDVLARHGLPAATTDFAPFVSLDPPLVERRVLRALAPPPTVRLTLSDGELRAAGVAPGAWIDEARLLGRSLPGVAHYEDRELRSAEALEALGQAASSLEGLVIPFERGQARVGQRQESQVKRAEDEAKRALQLATTARLGACIAVTGHADRRGTQEQNQALSDARAAAIAERLAGAGVDAAQIQPRGAGAWEVAGPHARSVTVRLETSDQRPGCGGTR